MEQFNINRGVYIATMDFLRDGYDSLYKEMNAKYDKRYKKAWNNYERFFGKVFCTMK